MNCTVNSQILAHEMRLVNKIAPAKHAVAVLTHVLLQADGNKLHFYTTDLEIGLRTACPVETAEPGQTCLPAARLLALLEQFPNAPVNLKTDGNGVRVTCGTFHTSRIQALPASEFPQPAEVEGTSHTVSGDGLRRLIALTRYAIDESAVKFVLKGALLDLAQGRGAMVATDAKRVAVAMMEYTGAPASVILPIKTLDVLANHLDGAEYTMTIGDRHSFFEAGSRLLISRMLDSKFPNYQRIIPTQTPHEIVVDRLALAFALRRVGLSSGDEHRVYLDVQSGSVDLTAQSAQLGDAHERVPVTYNGAPIRVAVNWELLVETLDAARGGEVTIKLSDPLSPMLVMDGDNYLVVVMLLRENIDIKTQAKVS